MKFGQIFGEAGIDNAAANGDYFPLICRDGMSAISHESGLLTQHIVFSQRMGRIQTLGEIPPTPLSKGSSQSLKVFL